MTQWWQKAVIYEIYCRSFFDSNKDGTGDLKGISQQLEHVASLGVDAIWITPFYKSPMADMGYDVSDYKDIDPQFGTLDDFSELVETAHQLDLKVIIDLVFSHTSDQHPWFQQSSASKDNDKSDWYVWADPVDDEVPNNWLSLFGGSAWQWHDKRKQFYLHNFLASQPDLNLHNPEVQQQLLEVAEYWCQLGVDGFRLDTVNFYFHDQMLRSNPDISNPTFQITPESNPYSFQDHLYDKNQPENLAFLARLRQVTDKYDAVTLGELGEDGNKCLQLINQYTRGDHRLHLCYGFDLLSGGISADKIRNLIEAENEYAPDAWICHAFSNHDVVRHLSRWSCEQEHWFACGLLALNLLLSLRGASCIYQGEELGLNEAKIEFDDLQDPYGKQFWPDMPTRDGCRTPFPWRARAEHAGFSEVKPWLPVPEEHFALACDQQQGRDSMLNQYRHWIEWHKHQPVLHDGTTEQTQTQGDILTFVRKSLQGQMLAVFCIGNQTSSIEIGTDWLQHKPVGFGFTSEDNRITFEPWGFVFWGALIK